MNVTISLCRKCLRTLLPDTPCECQGGPVIDWQERERQHWREFWRKRREKLDEAIMLVLNGGNP